MKTSRKNGNAATPYPGPRLTSRAGHSGLTNSLSAPPCMAAPPMQAPRTAAPTAPPTANCPAWPTCWRPSAASSAAWWTGGRRWRGGLALGHVHGARVCVLPGVALCGALLSGGEGGGGEVRTSVCGCGCLVGMCGARVGCCVRRRRVGICGRTVSTGTLGICCLPPAHVKWDARQRTCVPNCRQSPLRYVWPCK